MRLVPALAVAACLGCAAGPRLRPVPPDGGGWREVRTEHFALRTDLPPDRARALAVELEAVAVALDRALFGDRSGPLDLDVDVIAMADEADLEPFMPRGLRAVTYSDARSGRLVILMPGSFGALQRAIVAHELSHALLAASHARQPPWFREGIACYVETIAWDGPDVAVGRIPPWRRWPPRPPSAATIRALLGQAGTLDAEQYRAAWGLVHFLLETQGERFEALQRRFDAGEEPVRAWAATFPEWDPRSDAGAEALRDAAWAHLTGPRVSGVKRGDGPPVVAPRERPLMLAEVHDVRLGLPWRAEVPSAVRAAELDAAVARGSVVAAAIRAEQIPAERRALAERAVREHPGDPRAWILLATAEATGPAREADLRRAIGADPRSVAARTELARFLVVAGRAEDALGHAQEAARLAPWSPAALATLAAVMHARGRCSEALWLLRRAAASVPEATRVALEQQTAELLRDVERSCRAAP